jgi:hypothetical protein
MRKFLVLPAVVIGVGFSAPTAHADPNNGCGPPPVMDGKPFALTKPAFDAWRQCVINNGTHTSPATPPTQAAPPPSQPPPPPAKPVTAAPPSGMNCADPSVFANYQISCASNPAFNCTTLSCTPEGQLGQAPGVAPSIDNALGTPPAPPVAGPRLAQQEPSDVNPDIPAVDPSNPGQGRRVTLGAHDVVLNTPCLMGEQNCVDDPTFYDSANPKQRCGEGVSNFCIPENH